SKKLVSKGGPVVRGATIPKLTGGRPAFESHPRTWRDMAWYKRTKDDKEDEGAAEKRSVPVGVFTKCPGCREALLTADLHKNLDVCPKCDHHFLLGTRDRVAMIIDPGTFEEADARVESIDPLAFRDSKRYADRVRSARRQAGT